MEGNKTVIVTPYLCPAAPVRVSLPETGHDLVIWKSINGERKPRDTKEISGRGKRRPRGCREVNNCVLEKPVVEECVWKRGRREDKRGKQYEKVHETERWAQISE